MISQHVRNIIGSVFRDPTPKIWGLGVRFLNLGVGSLEDSDEVPKYLRLCYAEYGLANHTYTCRASL